MGSPSVDSPTPEPAALAVSASTASQRQRRRARRLAWLGAAALTLAGALAVLALGAVGDPWVPRLWLLAALALCGTLAAALALDRTLAGLHAAAPPAAEPPPAERAWRESRALQRRLEAQLEHAPVALWRVALLADGERAGPQALNAAARRLLAPGGVVDAAAFGEQIAHAAPGRRQLIAYDTERGHERALVASAAVTLAGDAGRVLALLPVEAELESETLAAWQQLVHVLTHEIMNSLTPIAALAGTARELALELTGNAADAAALHADLHTAIDTVARRAAHLASFVESYRSVSRWPPPTLAPLALAGLFESVTRLVEPAWRAAGGSVRHSVEPPSLSLRADAAQLEQVLLNLARNALEATCAATHDGSAPVLSLAARLGRGARLVVEVADNGPGVPAGQEARIFTPFFSTKAAAGEPGRGIGLAVVRQLVHGMGGTVRLARRPAGGACFVLTF
jgi:signal transduction histidine kinase